MDEENISHRGHKAQRDFTDCICLYLCAERRIPEDFSAKAEYPLTLICLTMRGNPPKKKYEKNIKSLFF